ncbi:MAG: methyltransferase domain-containing protein, partial [Bacteroidota bacterium]
VLEIGSAEAGVLKAFTELGCTCLGIELQESRVEHARHFMASEMEAGLVDFISRDIYDINPDEDLPHRFDLIILKDVIEHIHDQARFMARVGDFLQPGGKIFYGFPPWHMPFGGHQQVAKNKLFSKVPYTHLLPMPLYRAMWKMVGETEQKVYNLAEIKETGISIQRFERINREGGFQVARKKYYLFNPIYRYKFGLKPREQVGFIANIPRVRDFLTTGVYYLMELATTRNNP